MDEDELGLVKWGFHPVFGYVNSFQDSPALSDDPNTWPSAWPSTGTMTKWPGEWDGRFGRGVQYADLETYFVFKSLIKKIVELETSFLFLSKG